MIERGLLWWQHKIIVIISVLLFTLLKMLTWCGISRWEQWFGSGRVVFQPHLMSEEWAYISSRGIGSMQVVTQVTKGSYSDPSLARRNETSSKSFRGCHVALSVSARVQHIYTISISLSQSFNPIQFLNSWGYFICIYPSNYNDIFFIVLLFIILTNGMLLQHNTSSFLSKILIDVSS